MWLYILQGIGYGFAAAAQPGPLQTYLISQAITKGWKTSLTSFGWERSVGYILFFSP